MSTVLLVSVAVVMVLVVIFVVSRSRRSQDGVDSFRRQIDALSPEARRPVVDEVQNVAGRTERPVVEPDTDDSEQTPDDDQDGTRGT